MRDMPLRVLTLGNFSGEGPDWLSTLQLDGKQLLMAVAALLVGLALTKIAMRLADRALRRSSLSQRLHAFVRTLIKVVLLAVVALTAASILGVPVTSFVAVLSVAGLAVSLAIQGALSNVAGSLMVLGSKPYTVGDYVQIGEVAGTVREIGMLATRLVTVDNKVVIMPNGKIISSTITNFSAEPTRRLDLSLTVPYGADIERVKAAVADEVNRHPLAKADPQPVIRLSEIGEDSLTVCCLVWADTEHLTTLRYDLNERIKAALDKVGIGPVTRRVEIHLPGGAEV